MLLLKYPIIIANIAAKILGLLSKSKEPVLSKNIGGKIIAGKMQMERMTKFFLLYCLICLL